MLLRVNLFAGWFAILLGLVAGAVIGMLFHNEDWLEGYGGWRRRMLRLFHISLVGTGLLNLALGLTVTELRMLSYPWIAGVLMLAGAATMPTVCALSVWRKEMRHLFFVPVLSLVVAIADLIYEGFLK
jgi:uncharacterized membrane protein YqgA involved in biofilm formation